MYEERILEGELECSDVSILFEKGKCNVTAYKTRKGIVGVPDSDRVAIEKKFPDKIIYSHRETIEVVSKWLKAYLYRKLFFSDGNQNWKEIQMACIDTQHPSALVRCFNGPYNFNLPETEMDILHFLDVQMVYSEEITLSKEGMYFELFRHENRFAQYLGYFLQKNIERGCLTKEEVLDNLDFVAKKNEEWFVEGFHQVAAYNGKE